MRSKRYVTMLDPFQNRYGKVFTVALLLPALALGGLSYQALYQRILSAASSAQAQITCFAAAGTVFIMGIPSVVIGVMAAAVGNLEDPASCSPTPHTHLGGSVRHWFCGCSCYVFYGLSTAVLSIHVYTKHIQDNIEEKGVCKHSLILPQIKQLSCYYLLVFPPLQASERELQWVIRISVLLVGLAGTSLAFGDDSVAALWILSGDLLYCVIFPQLVCVLHFQRANTYGAICGFVVGLLLRGLSGEPVLGIPPLLLYPGCREENDQIRQCFPYRTVAMLSSLISIMAVSWLLDLIFHRQLIPESWDFLHVFKKKNKVDEDETPDPCEEINQVLNTKF
ncbi:hypothetical protein GOODEAATRI_022155 [Goodea atripinnis]|uniref:Uncharacterized protein n=1 Tax=Goodea atripinnis TaxID=208336 RepID=A0ABV0NZF0_9TELE